jgi:filamentous hemagglutinin
VKSFIETLMKFIASGCMATVTLVFAALTITVSQNTPAAQPLLNGLRGAACSESAITRGLEGDAVLEILCVDESSEHDASFAPTRSRCEVIAALTDGWLNATDSLHDIDASITRIATDVWMDLNLTKSLLWSRFVNASANSARGNSTEQSTTYTNTTVTGGQAVNLISGGDTTLRGAQAIAPNITANIGGDLNIQSLQDSATATARQTSQSGSLSVGVGSVSGSYNQQNSNGTSNYQSVNQQSGLFAGDGGFQIDVKGNTTLIGGAIVSTDAARQNNLNALTTQTISATDLQNQSTYSARTSGMGVALGTGPGQTGITPGIPQRSSGNETSSTQSGVTVNADGSGINTTKPTTGTLNTTAVATLTTDKDGNVTGANTGTGSTALHSGPLTRAPDINQIISTQRERQTAAVGAGQAVARSVGDYADSQARDARERERQAIERGDTEGAAQARRDADSWGEGGMSRAITHAVGQGVVGALAGNAATGVQAGVGAGA